MHSRSGCKSICIACLIIRTWLIGLQAHLIVDCKPISLQSHRLYSFIWRIEHRAVIGETRASSPTASSLPQHYTAPPPTSGSSAACRRPRPQRHAAKPPSTTRVQQNQCWAATKLQRNQRLITTRNIHFYDKNLNNESETVKEEHFLWRIFTFRHRSPVMILQPSLSIMKSNIVTRSIIEEHTVSSHITHATHLWRSSLEVWWPGLRHWTNYTSVMKFSICNEWHFVINLYTVFSPSDVCLWELQLVIRDTCNSSWSLALGPFSMWRVPVGPFSIRRVPIGPRVTHPWHLQFIIKVFTRSFIHPTCTCGTLLHPTSGTQRLTCHVYL
jgi:hypothetical protein